METPPDPTPPAHAAQESAAQVTQKAVKGAKIMTLLGFAQICLRFLSTKATSVYLSNLDFDNFGPGSKLTGIGGFLSDVGLAGALVRKGTEPTEDELITIFLSQQLLAGLFVGGVLAFLPLIRTSLHMNHTATLVLLSLCFGVFLQTLRVIPMLVLERKLKFDAIARCEMLESVVQVLVTITMTLMKFGVWALVAGYWSRGIIGLIAIWIASPWRPQGTFRWGVVKELAKFGLPYQLNSLIPTLGDFWMVPVLKQLLTEGALGLVTWSGNIASIPMTINNMLVRVAYPAYSRLQSDSAALAEALQGTVRRLTAIFDLVISPFVTLCPFLIPFLLHPKWAPAVPIVQWLCVQAVVSMLLGTVCSVQNALGKASERMWVTVGMAVLRWATGYWAISRFGLAGYGPIGLVTLAFELWLSGVLVRRHNPKSATLLRDLFGPLLISWVTLALALVAGHFLGHGILWQIALLSTTAWVLLSALRETLTPFRMLRGELEPLLAKLLRKRA